MKLACCVWALASPEDDLLRQIRELGFAWIDIQPGHLRRSARRQLAAELGLQVSCLGASFDMPAGCTLDHENNHVRRRAIAHVAEAIDHASNLGAETVYVIPGNDHGQAALRRYADALAELADYAGARNIKMAVEHFPGTALHSAEATLAFLKDLDQPNAHLLYDSGHIQMTNENPTEVIEGAGDRLAYAHFDDNDGEGDLHLALLDGVMTEATLLETIRALRRINYRGAVSLELHPELADPVNALARSRDILLRALDS